MSGAIRCAHQGHLARVSLCHPGKFNAMSRAMWRELRQVFEAIQADASVRCVVLQGEGGHFCAGGDIAEYPDFRFNETALRDFHDNDVWGGLQAMLRCDVPIVAQLEGNCMGAGVEIACCCDVRIAAESARFGAPIARLGFPMAPRETALVSGQLGSLLAREVLLEAAVLDAPQMLRRGFLSRVVADEELLAQTSSTAERIMRLAPQAARLNKRTLRALQNAARPNADDGEDDILQRPYRYADSPEHREGIAAFLDKRQPIF